MGRGWIAAGALLATGCAACLPPECAPCAGPGYHLTGLPDRLPHPVVRVCIAGHGCTTEAEQGPTTTAYQQYLRLPDGLTWDDADGLGLRVVLRTHHRRWAGTGTLHAEPAGPGVCSCGSLDAQVPMSRVPTPRG